MAVLVKFHKKLESTNGALVLCEIDSEILKAFKTMRLDKVFDIARSEKDAVRKLKKMF